MVMKKFINDGASLTAELMEGFAIAHGKKIVVKSAKSGAEWDGCIVARANPKAKGKVQIVTLGGTGHEPALSGFVGEGMLDYSVAGDVFAAPGAPKVVEALKEAAATAGDAGVLFVILNHAGDVLSGNMAMEMAEKEGIKIKKILTHEDIAAGPDAPIEDKRGLVGCISLYKVAGAAAEAGKSLDEVFAIAEKINDNMANLAVAMKGATHPQSGDYIATLEDDQMEIGMGQHGEAGTGPCPVKSADETAKVMLDRVLAAVDAKKGDKVLVVINGSGSTTLMEQYIVLRAVKNELDSRGIELVRAVADEWLTVQEMGGFQMFVAKMDDELVELWDAPCDTPALTVR
ncbi:MAG: dihydroxyacetone kinase subunit DhaK [Planctomycetota bacterium]|jgi:dihydroxyacetone kinase-like protein